MPGSRSSAVSYALAALAALLAAFEPAAPLRAAERTVVLANGNVLHGHVVRRGTTVAIHSGGIQLRVPKSEIEMIAPDLPTAYRRKSTAIADYDTASRCRLVRWCVRHGLKHEAQAEIAALRKQNPDHPQISSLSRQVHAYRSDWSQTALPRSAALPPDRQHAQKMRTRLTKNTLAQFARQVQPLLLNRCGQANCHGSATKTPYQLFSSPLSKIPVGLTERNLGATLRNIGDLPPPQTLLWTSASSVHGNLDRHPLNAAQRRILLEWIEQTAAELSGRPNVESSRSGRADVDATGATVGDVDPFDPAPFNAQTSGETR